MRSLFFLAPLGLFVCYLVAGYVGWDSGVDFSAPPGITAPTPPLQRPTSRPPIEYGEYTLTPVAEFQVTGRLIMSERYWSDSMSSLAPIDLVVGWQELSDTSVLSKFDWGHSGRHVSFGFLEPVPLRAGQIGSRFSNIHAVPGSSEIADALTAFKPGEMIELRGLLISAKAGNWRLGSSTSRNDSGSGACEVMFIEQARTFLPSR